MKLIFLGTSASQPTEKRGLSCICLEKDGEILMFDAGEAAQISYMKSGLGWNKKMKIFIDINLRRDCLSHRRSLNHVLHKKREAKKQVSAG